MKLIGLHGLPGSGKDTAAKSLIKAGYFCSNYLYRDQDDGWPAELPVYLAEVVEAKAYKGIVFPEVRSDAQADFIRGQGGLVIHLIDKANTAFPDGITIKQGDLVLRWQAKVEDKLKVIDEVAKCTAWSDSSY